MLAPTSIRPPPSPLTVLDWGRTRYEPARLAPEALLAQHLAGEITAPRVFTEHDPVFTVGLRADAEDHRLWDAARFAAINTVGSLGLAATRRPDRAAAAHLALSRPRSSVRTAG